MRCMACGAEMRLMQVVRDDTMMVAGYEHHTSQCSSCNEIEQRFVFSREGTLAEPVAIRAVKSVTQPASGVWARAFARFRFRQTG
jgi:hypothetical protein